MSGSNHVASGFNQLWTCGRASYGSSSGKVCFGVLLKEKLECRSYENFGVEKHQFRVGVGTEHGDIVPGQDDTSIAVDNFGMIVYIGLIITTHLVVTNITRSNIY